MKKIFYYACLTMFAFAATFTLTACGDDEDNDNGNGKDNGNELVGWYLCSDELLTEETAKSMTTTYSGDEAIKTYSYMVPPTIIHIVDATHLDYYEPEYPHELGEEDAGGKDKLYQIKSVDKIMAYYGVSERKVYNNRTDGGFDFVVKGWKSQSVAVGDLQVVLEKTDRGFNIVEGCFIKGPYNKVLLKYDPNTVY